MVSSKKSIAVKKKYLAQFLWESVFFYCSKRGQIPSECTLSINMSSPYRWTRLPAVGEQDYCDSSLHQREEKQAIPIF
jgi:hypothetical protein